MKACKSKVLASLIGAALTLTAVPNLRAQTVNYNGSDGFVSVRQGIQTFANHYGNIVIEHGPLNMNATIASNFSQGEPSNQAIRFLAQAADASSIRVYFVRPALSPSDVTRGAAAVKLVAYDGRVNFQLNHISSGAAITSIAAADNAEVRFTEGAPTGMITFSALSMPIDQAISTVASRTHTHWSVGYIMQSMNAEGMSNLTASNAGAAAAISSQTPAIENPIQSGDSTAASVASASEPTSGDSTAAASDNSTQRQVAEALPAGSSAALTVIQGDKQFTLPPEKPLARDASGNILPITVHITQPVYVPSKNGKNNAANYYSSDPSLQLGNAFDLPTSNSFGNVSGAPGTIQTYTPNTSPSGLNFLPYGYGGGGGFTSTYPNFYSY